MGARIAEHWYMKNERKGGGGRIMLHCLGSCREMVTEILTIFEILHI